MIRTCQIFSRLKSDSSEPGPLDAACQWAAEHCQQGDDEIVHTPMLIFNEECLGVTDKPYRQMVVLDVATFLDQCRGRATPMFYHEIAVDGPVKLALDLEIDFAKADKVAAAFGTTDEPTVMAEAAQLAAAFVGRALVALSALAGRPLGAADVVWLDCTRPGKFSKHVVFDGSSDEHESVAFASNADCGELVRRLKAEQPSPALDLLVDEQVYAPRHPLRTYYSAKRGKEAHLMRAGSGPCDAALMARALRTCFRVHIDGEFYHQSEYATTAYMVDNNVLANEPIRLVRRQMGAASRTSRPSAASSSTLVAAIIASPLLAKYEPAKGHFRGESEIVIDCATLQCEAHPSGAHSHRCVFLLVDVLAQTYVQLCNSSTCSSRRQEARPRHHALPADLTPAVKAFLESEWPSGVARGGFLLRKVK